MRCPARQRTRVASATAVPTSCVVKWDTYCTSSGTINPYSLQVFDQWWFCEEVGVVKRVHFLSGEVSRVATALKVVEEVQEEVQEFKDE